MAWQDQLRKASWKDLRFFVEGTELSGGWEIDLKKIPVQETISPAAGNQEAEQKIKDLLRKDAQTTKATDTAKNPKIHNVRMHFVGNKNAAGAAQTYIDARNAMIKALDEGGQGDLILPTYGKIRALAGQYRTEFDNTVGGFEPLEVEFYEVSREPQVTSRVDTTKQLEISSVAAKDQVEEDFAYSATTEPSTGSGPEPLPEPGVDPEPAADFVLEEAEKVAISLADDLFTEIGLGVANDKVNEFVKRLDDFKANVSVIVRKPVDYVNDIRTLTEDITSIFDAPIDGFNAAKRIFLKFGINLPLRDIVNLGSTFDDIFSTTPDREQQRLNEESVVFSVKTVAAIQMADTAAKVQFVTSRDVSVLIDDVVETLDSLALEIGDSQQRQELYDSINDVKTKFLADISRASANLPGLKTIKTSKELPSLVIAYDLYADAERQDEIIERNKIESQLFCPVELEVLTF